MPLVFNPFTGTLDYTGTTVSPGTSNAATSKQSVASVKNSSGGAIPTLTPVVISAAGGFTTIDVSSFDPRTLAVTSSAIADGSFSSIVLQGVIEDVTTPLAIGDSVYVSKTGGLTSTLPSVGVDGFVAGDALIIVGDIIENSANAADKDLVVDIRFVVELS